MKQKKALTLARCKRLYLLEYTEELEVLTGVVAQIMGHKPSATAERHYKVRPIELLRKWHVTIERWILGQSGVSFDYEEEQQPGLKLVQGGEK